MDNKSKFIIAFCVIGMAVNVWFSPKAPPVAAPKVDPAAEVAAKTDEVKKVAPLTPVVGQSSATSTAAALPEEKIELKSGPVTYTFTNQGGGIQKAESHSNSGGIEVVLNVRGKAPVGALSAGVKTWNDLSYRVLEKSEATVTFEAESPDHLLIRKEYALSKGDEANPHLLSLKLTITNNGAAKYVQDSLYIYTGASASARPDEIIHPSFVWNDAGDAESADTTAFRDGAGFLGFGGPIPDIQKSLEKLRWAGSMSRFDAILVIPNGKDDVAGKVWSEKFLIDHANDEFKDDSKAKQDYAIHAGLSVPPLALESAGAQSFDYKIYLGPKIYADLNKLDNDETHRDFQTRFVMMYGWFTPVSRFLVFLLRIFHDWFNNWGAAIILLTCCIRTVLWPLQARSNATMKKMSLLSPELKKLQEKFKDDPARQNTEMMKLYKEYGVNPLGGCLPMFLQIPIFFGFYRVLQSAAELRGQSWFWVKDLSMPDTVWHIPNFGYPLNILPLLMGITMILQMKFTPQPQAADKTQQRIMTFMPLIFLYISYNFASALALYWTAQNIFSISQVRIQKLWQKDPVLEKVKIASSPAPSSGGAPGSQPDKKSKPGPPRPGGGRTKSTRKD
jgi:YidC/Oxa1 family membrane protein insertase